MCGIVGLLLKKPALRPHLGELMVPMLVGMTERGPDSAGLAVYTKPVSARHHKLSLYSGEHAVDWSELLARIAADFEHAHEIATHGNHAVLTSAADPDELSAWLATNAPMIAVLSVGKSIDLYKDVGAPADIAERYRFRALQGSHLVGHTRMATESAVTPAHAHPFTAGRDFCLVHNGSLSNPHLVRKRLEPLGIEFETDNDTEAACRFFEWRLREPWVGESPLTRTVASAISTAMDSSFAVAVLPLRRMEASAPTAAGAAGAGVELSGKSGTNAGMAPLAAGAGSASLPVRASRRQSWIC